MFKNNRVKKEKDKLQVLHEISFNLNGKNVTCKIKSSALLLDLIRDYFELKGTKPGCYEGECGACTVLVNNAPINSCLYPAINANGKNITTIEGLMNDDGTLHPVQDALIEHGAVQCGFCTSGMAMSIAAMASHFKISDYADGEKSNEIPNREEIKKYLEGNLCRCTGYVKIIDAAESMFIKKYTTKEY